MTTDILILDGGLGTTLIKDHGVQFNATTPLWTAHLLLSDHQMLLKCQQEFGNVPVDIILTATYQITKEALRKTATETHPSGIPFSKVPDIVNDAINIANEATQHDTKIALSLGPYGTVETQEYSGAYDSAHDTIEALQTWHTERLQLFVNTLDLESRVAYIALETIPRLDEIEAIRKAIDGVQSLHGIPFWMTCVFPGEVERIPSGHSVKEVVNAMLGSHVAQARPWGIGINCTQAWKLDALLRQFESAIADMLAEKEIADWPALVLYPDGTNGEVFNMDIMGWEMPKELVNVEKVPWERQVADVVWATQSRGKWRQIVVGGCCQSNAGDIERLRGLLKGPSASCIHRHSR